MAACDAYYKFTAVDVGGEGSNPDGAIFRNSGFGDLLLRGKLNLPKPKSLPGSNVTLPHFQFFSVKKINLILRYKLPKIFLSLIFNLL